MLRPLSPQHARACAAAHRIGRFLPFTFLAVLVPIITVGCDAAAPVGAAVVENDPPPEVTTNGDGLVPSTIVDPAALRSIRALPVDGGGSLSWSFNVVGAPAEERESFTFQWDFGHGESVLGAAVTHTFGGPGRYAVSVAVTDPSGVTAYTLSEAIDVNQPPEVFSSALLIVLMDAHLDVADSVFTLRAWARTNALESGETVHFEWLFADGATDVGAEITHVLQGESPYKVTVTARTNQGRSASYFQYFILAGGEELEPLTDSDTNGEDDGGEDLGGGGLGGDGDDPPDDDDPPDPPAGALRAFPSAEGFGAFARGGRSGQVVYVTNLQDYVRILPNGQGNPAPIVGSLRWACEIVTGPRTILFKVGGTIPLLSRVFLIGEQGSYVTIAGQSAPGDGVQITGFPLQIGNGAHDVVVRFLRSRPGWVGPEDPGIKDALTVSSDNGSTTRHIMIDHCSLEWAIDENGGVGDWVENLTFQWCIFGEGSVFGHNGGGGNSSGMLLSGENGLPSDQYLTVHHSLFTGNMYRNPYLTENGGLVDLVNNYICNFTVVGTEILPLYTYAPRANIVGNAYDDSMPGFRPIVVRTLAGREIDDGSFFVEHNLSEFTPTIADDPWEIMGHESENHAVSESKRRFTPWPMADGFRVTTDLPSVIVDRVLGDVGANYPAWDPVDQRLIVEARNGTGDPGFGPSIEDHEDWPVLSSGTPYPDADNDGMDDSWEIERGLNPTIAADGLADDDGDGYTNLEEFLNSLVGE